MRRIFFVFIGLSILLLLGAVLFLAYRQRQSYAVTIPQEAASVIRINVDGLVTDILWNALWHPEYYKQHGRAGREEAGRILRGNTGLPVPANLFLYRFADMPSAVFGMLPITDMEEFQAFVRSYDGWAYDGGTMPGRLTLANTLALHTTDTVAFAFFWGGENGQLAAAERHLQDMLQGSQQVSLSASRFRELKNRKGHINALGDWPLRVDFQRGKIAFSTGAEWDGTLSWKLAEGNTGVLQLPLHYWSWAPSNIRQLGSNHVLRGDSLIRYMEGSMVIRWLGVTTQADTVITYDYDEDFNPIETQTTVDRIVPAVYATIPADARELAGYLADQGILDTVSGQVNREIFPLFPVHFNGGDDAQLLFSTVADAGKKQFPPPISSHGGDSLRLYLNIAEALGQDVFPAAVARYLAPFSALALKGGGHPADGSAIHGKLTMKEHAINSFVQLYQILGSKQPSAPTGEFGSEHP